MKKFIIIPISLLLFSIPLVNAKAPEKSVRTKATAGERMEKVEEKKAEVMEKKEERLGDRCAKIGERLNNRLSNFGGNKEKHVEIYNRLTERLSAIVSKLEEKGLDVSKLKSDIAVFDTMVLDYASSYTVIVDTLESANSLECGNSDGDFKNLLQNAKDQLSVAKEKRDALKEFYRTVIREDIKDLREQASSTEGDN